MAKKRAVPVTIATRAAALVALGCSFLLTACVASSPEVTVDDPELRQGREIYSSSCASCHGSAGNGGVGLKLSEGAVIDSFPTIEAQIDLVKAGRNNMPAYGDRLSDAQVRAVVRYTREVL